MATTYECFLISAFGEKPLLRNPNETVDFDKIQHEIKDAVQLYSHMRPDIHITIKRSDEYASGVISHEFFQQLYRADLVIAEISSPSPNVYYELGVRVALKRRTTILLALEDTPLPFDLKDLRVLFYAPGRLIEKSDELHRLMEARLGGENDSPVFTALPDLQIIRKIEIDELQEQIRIFNGLTSRKMFDIRITSPKDGEEVGEWTTVTGVYDTLPPQDSIRLFNKVPGYGYWPQPLPILLNPAKCTWEGKFHLGGKPPEEGIIVAAIIGKSARTLCEYFDWSGEQNGKWPVIRKLTDDIVECDSVCVFRSARGRRFWRR